MSDLTTVSPWDAFMLHPFEVMFSHEVDDCNEVWLDGGHDDAALSMQEDGWHAFRVGAKVIVSDEQGFDYGYHYAEVEQATAVMDALHQVELNEDEELD